MPSISLNEGDFQIWRQWDPNFQLFFYGASRGNPKEARGGRVIFGLDEKKIAICLGDQKSHK